jgi:DNA modification methylase
MQKLDIKYQNITDLKPQARNPRTHSKKQIRQIVDSIKEFGFINPILVDQDNSIIAGHGRVKAARLAGLTEVPTLQVDHLSPAQIRAYVIADNKLAENAGWDRELLVLELKELEITFHYDLKLTGFETAEIDLLYGDAETADAAADEIPEIDATKPAVSRLGDLWKIGSHYLLCGDALDPGSYAHLLDGETAQMVFTDPPYNVRIDGHVSGLGKVKHREFQMASGEMSKAEFTAFLETVFHNLADHSADGALHYICMDWRHIEEVLQAAKSPYTALENLCVWNKTNGGMGSFYRSKHELVFVFKNGTASHINNVLLGAHGRYRTNVWDYAGANTFAKDREEELAMHPTVKPVALVADAILDASDRGAAVIDAFAGSGTTLIAAEKTARRGYGIELDPRYVDTIIARMKKTCGLEAELVGADMDFETIRKRRSTDAAWEQAMS